MKVTVKSFDAKARHLARFVSWPLDYGAVVNHSLSELFKCNKSFLHLALHAEVTRCVSIIGECEINLLFKMFCRKNIEKNEAKSDSVLSAMKNLKTALWRAWDDKHGTFGQLPWKNSPGFALDKYSFGLTP